MAPSGIWFVAGVASLVVAVVAAFLPRRRLVGAVVGLLAVPALMRAEPFGFTGRLGAVRVAVVLPGAGQSGYRVASRRSRERMRMVATAAVLVALIGTIVFALAVWISFHDLSSGSQVGPERAGRSAPGPRAPRRPCCWPTRRTRWGRPTTCWVAGGRTPAHLVPFVSQQLDALSTASGQGHDVAAAGAVVASKADYHELRYVQGQIDVNRLRQLDGPLRTVNQVLGHAGGELSEVRSPWLVGPVRGAVDTFAREVDQTVPQARVAEQAVAVAPAMLGGQGTRHYFVAFTTEAESRGLNGFMGNWAELTATDGRLTMSRSGRVSELNAVPGGVPAAWSPDPPTTSSATAASRWAPTSRT